MTVLQRRQMIVDAVGPIEARLKPIKQQWLSIAPDVEPNLRGELEAKFAQARDLLLQINQADSDDVLMIQQRKIEIGQQLRRTGTARMMNQKYAAGTYAAAGGRMDVSR